jgi:hypothetical protein
MAPTWTPVQASRRRETGNRPSLAYRAVFGAIAIAQLLASIEARRDAYLLQSVDR